MIRDDDPRWASMRGGYRVPYDPRQALERLRADGNDSRAWDELWQNLHHQGDLGEASYVAVVALAEMCETTLFPNAHLFGLVSTIEIERRRRTNPEVPEWLASDYRSAWRALLPHALRALKASADPEELQSAMVVMCLAKGLTALGAVLWYHDQDTLSEYLDERLAWTELYANKAG
jgi:hypothetical protein